MSEHRNDSFDELVRRALHAEADRIDPADALPEIRARAHAQRRPASRRPWLLTAGVATVGTAAAIGAFTVLPNLNNPGNTANDGDAVAGSGTTSTTAVPTTGAGTPAPSKAVPSVAPSVAAPEQSVHNAVVPVYWLGQQIGATKKSTARLYRTWAKVSGHPAEEAVRIMTTKQPTDPDYFSVWRGAALNAVTRTNDKVTVDFKQLPKATLDADVAAVAAQQLVYTVQGALNDDSVPVQITQGGQAVPKLFGQVDTSMPLGREQATNVQALVWIDSPDQDAVTGDRVTVSGVANAFEATVNYQATNVKTRETKKSFTTSGQGQSFSPYSFQLTLSPGTWQINVYLVSPADGRVTDTDSKSIVVK
ncbi:Gmad2 immunoglobulin-like domain-containing protein [Kribbella solani]|uniref:GerMN domain-containing protein n=1 Tax=Kribbella solani TaxID=236067 RepID=A0A841DRW2_9ACTN|nr:Gmad2 immunoglobulin-like domain-containing protein [Kribbella solani]MBB5979516.1 hypothetical protein [Kribbella solani]